MLRKHRLLVDIYGEHAPSKTSCKEWFRWFNSGDFDVRDKEHEGAPKKFEDAELQALFEKDSCLLLDRLAKELNVDRSTVGKRLHAMGMVQKEGNWVPYKLKERDMERRLVICEMLRQWQQRKGFLHRIVTGDEKWIYYGNPKHLKAWVMPGPSTPKWNIHASKIMLCIWWDQRGIIYYELLKPSETITGDRYWLQLIRLNQALKEKRLEWAQ